MSQYIVVADLPEDIEMRVLSDQSGLRFDPKDMQLIEGGKMNRTLLPCEEAARKRLYLSQLLECTDLVLSAPSDFVDDRVSVRGLGVIMLSSDRTIEIPASASQKWLNLGWKVVSGSVQKVSYPDGSPVRFFEL